MIDTDGLVLKRDVVASDPDVISKWLGKHCPGLNRVVLETGPLSTFLYHSLVERSVPVECIGARHADPRKELRLLLAAGAALAGS